MAQNYNQFGPLTTLLQLCRTYCVLPGVHHIKNLNIKIILTFSHSIRKFEIKLR